MWDSTITISKKQLLIFLALLILGSAAVAFSTNLAVSENETETKDSTGYSLEHHSHPTV